MTKKDFVKAVATKAGATQIDSKIFVDAVFDVLKEVVCSGDELVIHEFCRFGSVLKNQKRAMNFQTGEEMIIPARYNVCFKPADDVKQKVYALPVED